MRSQLAFETLEQIPTRYLLVRVAAKAVQTLHKLNTRLADTANDMAG